MVKFVNENSKLIDIYKWLDFISLLNFHLDDDQINVILIENNVNVNDKNRSGGTPLYSAVCNGNSKMYRRILNQIDKFLFKKNANFPISNISIFYLGNLRLLEILLKNGADSCIKDDDGLTPLHLAVQNGNFNCIFGCLTTCYQTNSICRNFMFRIEILFHDRISGDEKMVEILPKNSAYVNFRSNAGDTALHSAAKNGKIIVY